MERTHSTSCTGFFRKSLESLTPESLLDGRLHVEKTDQSINIRMDESTSEMENGCYVVGFGKAVLGLGALIARKLGKSINSGVLSIPWGTSENEEYKALIDVCQAANIGILEGAKDNLPDEHSYNAAKSIVHMVSNLTEKDVVIVLISGGGSALLPFPVEGVSLEEKLKVVQLLSRAGASITELNTVRKALSGVKGGKLAHMIQPAKVISLVLSDIIGDPLDFIASGPTVANSDEPLAALNIIKKYNLLQDIPQNVVEVLSRNKRDAEELVSSEIYVVGNNEKALQHIHGSAIQAGMISSIMSKEISGEAREIGTAFAHLALCVCSLNNNLEEVLKVLGIESDQDLQHSIAAFKNGENETLVLFGGGETTVSVKGSGKGGRNQEMVLSFGIALDEVKSKLTELGFEVEFLSCGTDGIDGPTDAAGAVWDMDCFDRAKGMQLDPLEFLEKNDSYNFWNKIGCLVKTGHTGTNVMDIQVLKIRKIS